ncbi:TIGR00725 family protein [Sphaerobacter sp.]|uniref:TIGR00725 family protein n=1 Tax=Sphaerobacter sp. TaxID=2099654 RepID=UPI001DF2AFD1|nr:TIGR00725 family protein [Sphaerobacter sp.]MBX5445292.1 TIGR00725 family protein [Sphaerobacter sp.]
MIAVCGPNEATDEEIRWAEEVGERIARAGHALVCGGRGGVMAAACRGARRAGGATIGILPGTDRREANEWVEHVICTGLGNARNAVVVASGEAVIAIGGGFGTLSEIALALKMGKHVIGLGSWDLDAARLVRFGGEGRYHRAEDPAQAVALALDAIAHTSAVRARRLEEPPSSHG